MAFVYNEVGWEDLPSTITPRNSTTLGKMDTGIKENNKMLNGSSPMGNVIVESIRSKNMLNLESFSSATINGITFTNNRNGSITINGTASASFGISFSKLSLKAGNYYLSPNVTGNSPSTFYLYDYNSLTSFGNGAITLSQDYNNLGFDTYINSGYYYDNVVIMPQLETGSVATSFSPYQQLKVNDTGWVDMSSYINTDYFYARQGSNPMVRKIGNVVYWRGAVYCHTSPNSIYGQLLSNLPTEFFGNYESLGSGVHWELGIPYAIVCGGQSINITEASNITPTFDYQGYGLTNIPPYIVD